MTKTSEKVRRKLALVEAPLKQFNPEMLILAREFHGMPVNDLATHLGVTPGFVCHLESGIKEPSEAIMERLVTVLKFPQQHYYQSGRRDSAHASFYRKRVVISPVILRQSTARMTEIKRNIEKLLSEVESESVRFPFLDPEESPGGVKEIAQKMRGHLRIAPGPIRDLTTILEEAGAIIVPFDFGTRKIDACSEWIGGHPVIFINKFVPASRQRFTLAHELGHIVMHKIIMEECEEQADQFAAEFTLPEKEIKPELAPVNLDRLARLKLKWKSSMGAILYRAADLGVITERTSRYHWMLMRRYGYHEVEPHEDLMAVEKPTALRELVEAFKDSMKMSRQELIEALHIYEAFFDEIYSDQPKLRIVE
ncbi:MAG TPA: XRE family transcriptional regulator [Verrucomicrobiae bacterium]|nr:XRE family transcriptional regulator [Verrucomicrobiae bacterium]